jgi:hypothetical protein
MERDWQPDGHAEPADGCHTERAYQGFPAHKSALFRHDELPQRGARPLALTTFHTVHIFCAHHLALSKSTRSQISQRVSHVIIRFLPAGYIEVSLAV